MNNAREREYMDSTTNKEPEPTESWAAIDLGSNSFHMVVAVQDGNSIRHVDSMRDAVRLGAGLDRRKRLLPETEMRALDTLARFAERLRDVPASNIRMVGTNTLRRARGADRFMRQAAELIGRPVEIVSGREEARLIWSAVAHTLPETDAKRLVIDIGGGSTELVIGQSLHPLLMESLNIGCVSMMRSAFSQGRIKTSTMKNAITEARLELQPVAKAYRELGWDEVVGCSGTIKAAARMLAETGLTDGVVQRDALKELLFKISDAGTVEKLHLQSISQSRTDVIAGGLAVLYGLMKTLSIDCLERCNSALREGLIFDMIGAEEYIGIRAQTIENLEARFSVDASQAARVEHTARLLFQHVAKQWSLDSTLDLDLLVNAARLHELGMGVAHTQYHKHGAYILEHSDLLGFTLRERTALALLVRWHRRKIDFQAFDGLPDRDRERLLKLLGLLRLAALLHRGRHDAPLNEIRLRIDEGRITVVAPRAWLDDHPLTAAELSAEAERLLHVNIRLKIDRS